VSALADILRADFLLRDALVGSVLLGLVCPLVGVYFLLRRMIFLGVALPQLSAAGIGLAFLLYSELIGRHQHGVEGERLLALVERGGRVMVEARIGTVFALASAATMLFVAVDPFGEAEMVNLLKGDIIATTSSSLGLLTVVLAIVTALLFAFRKELLLVSFDREMAIVLGKRAELWDALLYLLIGLTISLGVMNAGPLVTFGFLVIPPLTARLVTRRMLTFSLAASALGGAAAFLGFWAAYGLDLPLGPTEVALSGLGLLAVALLRWVVIRVRAPARD
jgi:ABC-type Mn2+/Zn2+ transport system permease subunit